MSGASILLNAVATTQTSAPAGFGNNYTGSASFQATVVGTGAVTANVTIFGSDDNGLGWVSVGTIAPSGTTSASDGFAIVKAWALYKAVLNSLSGTGALATVSMAG